MKILNLGFKKNVLLTVFLSIILVIVNQVGSSVYLSIFLTVSFSFFYGIIEPKRGWILAIIQIIIIVAFYWILVGFGIKAIDQNTAIFATHISIVPSLISPLLSSLIVRM